MTISDEVWHRVVGVIQEAMLMGIDCADLLRQIRVRPNDTGELVLTQGYKAMVREHHAKLLEEAEALQAQQANKNLIKVS